MSRTGEPRSWFVFGAYEDGRVDVSDGERDVLVGVSREDAERAIAEQQAIWDAWFDGEG